MSQNPSFLRRFFEIVSFFKELKLILRVAGGKRDGGLGGREELAPVGARKFLTVCHLQP